jgi:hypothetical protein
MMVMAMMMAVKLLLFAFVSSTACFVMFVCSVVCKAVMMMAMVMMNVVSRLFR